MLETDLSRWGSIEGLLKLLHRGRAIARVHLALRFGLRGLVCIAGFALVSRLVFLVDPAMTSWLVGAAYTPAFLGAVVAIWLLVTITLACVRAPTVPQLGRRADRVFQLQERVSTVVELTTLRPAGILRTSASENIITLLIWDAVRHSDRIRPARLVDRRFGGSLLVLVAVLVLFAGAQLVVPGSLVPTPVDGAAGPASAGRSSATATPVRPQDIQRAAAMVAVDAAKLKDPYLQALALSLQDLGAKIASGAIDPTAAEQQMSQVEDLLKRAYAQHAGQAVLAAPGAQAGNAAKAGKDAVTPTKAASGPSQPVVALPALTPSAGSSTLSDFVRQLERNASASTGASRVVSSGAAPATNGQNRTAPLAQTPQMQNSYFTQSAREAQIIQMQALYSAAGQPAGRPAGPAPHSTRGPGDAAGHGSQPLSDGTRASGGNVAASPGSRVVLPSTQVAGGQRIQVKAAPDTKRTQIVDVAPGSAAAAAQPSETALPIGPILDAGQRNAVAQYFLPSDAAGSGRSPTGQGTTP